MKTVEGYPIKVGECYQTRDGRKVFVHYLKDDDTIYGQMINEIDGGCWFEDGMASEINEPIGEDIMRPWPTDKPVVRENRITEEILKLACDAYCYGTSTQIGMRAALQAVFDHIGHQDSHIPPERPLKEPQEDECDICENAYISGMKEEFKAICKWCEREIKEVEQSQEAQDNDGWIEWGGGECPTNPYNKIEAKYRDKEIIFGLAGEFSWKHFSESMDIIAYKIIDKAIASEKSDGWIKHGGGNCSIDKKLFVEVKMKNGGTDKHQAKYGNWLHQEDLNQAFDIIAYRIIDEPKHDETRALMKLGLEDRLKYVDKDIRKEEKKEPKKQTLLEFIAEKKKTKKTREQLYAFDLISEYLEKYI